LTERLTKSQTDRLTNRQTGRQTDKQTNRQADKLIDRWADKQTNTQAGKTDKKAFILTDIIILHGWHLNSFRCSKFIIVLNPIFNKLIDLINFYWCAPKIYSIFVPTFGKFTAVNFGKSIIIVKLKTQFIQTDRIYIMNV
jgi:hypothetical protein